MNTYVALFLLATFASFGLTPLVRRLCERVNLLDVPNDKRRIHKRAVPRLGGVAIYASLLIALSPLLLIDNQVTASLREQASSFRAVMIASSLVFLFGVYDDLVGANARWKFLAQGLAGTLLYYLGGRVEVLSVPFFDAITLAPVMSFLLTVFWVVAISNAFNLIDGMDGLATGAALFASFVMLGVSIMNGRVFVSVITIVLAGSLIGFLRYNFNPASIFLGDSGALFIGFLLAALSTQGSQKASTAVAIGIPLLAFGLPIMDTSVSIIRRLVAGKPIFEGDRDHVHHKLLARGWSQRRVALVLYGVCALFGLCALLFTQTMSGATGFVLLCIGVATITTVNHLRYHEVEEIKDSLRRNITHRRQRTINNIRVRRAAADTLAAHSLSEALIVLRDLLEDSNFRRAVLRFDRADFDKLTQNIVEEDWRELKSERMTFEINDSAAVWNWRGDQRDHSTRIYNSHTGRTSGGATSDWALRLPIAIAGEEVGYINFYHDIGNTSLLLDINCLCNLYQPAFVATLARLIKEAATTEKQVAPALTMSVAGRAQ